MNLQTAPGPVEWHMCGRNSVVECQLPKLDVVGSNPIARCHINPLAERKLSVPAGGRQCGLDRRECR